MVGELYSSSNCEVGDQEVVGIRYSSHPTQEERSDTIVLVCSTRPTMHDDAGNDDDTAILPIR